MREIEVGSFVPASLLPQLADTAAALAAGAHKLTPPLSASETHSLKNLRGNHAQVLDEVRAVAAMERALPAGSRPHFEGSVPTAFGCTIEGVVDWGQGGGACQRVNGRGL